MVRSHLVCDVVFCIGHNSCLWVFDVNIGNELCMQTKLITAEDKFRSRNSVDSICSCTRLSQQISMSVRNRNRILLRIISRQEESTPKPK